MPGSPVRKRQRPQHAPGGGTVSNREPLPPHEVVERALARSTTSACIVIAEAVSSVNLRWAGNSLISNGDTRARTATVIALDHRADGIAAGTVTRAVADTGQLARLVEDAEAVARHQRPVEDALPLVASRSAVPGFTDPPVETDISVFTGLAPALRETFAEATAADRTLYGYAEHTVATTYVGSSSGLRARHDGPVGKLELTVKTGDGERSAWGGAGTTDFTDVDVEALAGQLAQRLAWGKRRVNLPPGRYETVLPPSAVADLMLHLYSWASSAEAIEGNNAFSRPGADGGTRIGERLSALPLDLYSDPSMPGLQCTPFVTAHTSGLDVSVFDNGHPLDRTDWIRDGVLTALPMSRHGASTTGRNPTPRIDNLILSRRGATSSMNDLISATDYGLLLTSLWYVRDLDPQTLLLTGLTRDGVYLIDSGEVVGEVGNFRFNDSPLDLLSRITEAGVTTAALPRERSSAARTAMPAVRASNFNMSTASRAR
ncbi:TldD/PmbA family protein [Streptacidiphilus sp. PB12-B1b]|uniref:metallopeptidase TldD-related protein n=1 Tax=Streptacidiphilus sp. PB12-B1b TaxID=2705012 RepID=UPI0015FAF56B|nr:metallopeptidase TldD-related protein [Streptacidiphilus sp. PB12-B1b]QMU78328.1 TldD/PmbA family protein [Streptacidiphilus sp. PB12-B1b]